MKKILTTIFSRNSTNKFSINTTVNFSRFSLRIRLGISKGISSEVPLARISKILEPGGAPFLNSPEAHPGLPGVPPKSSLGITLGFLH